MSTNTKKRQRQAKVLRDFRKAHRLTGIFLFVFFFFIAATGLLLGWKKNTGGLLLANTEKGSSTDLNTWLPFEKLQEIAIQTLKDSVGSEYDTTIDRFDARPDKGMVKVLFKDHYIAVQLDASTGKPLKIEQRRADFIENIHDGSIVDKWTNSAGGWFKLIYTTITALALLLFTITGFWLWYGPKRMRRQSHS